MSGTNDKRDVEASNDNPPTYDEAQKGAPPTYEESIMSKIRTAKRESDGNKEFVTNVLQIICESVALMIGCLVCTALLTALPISMIVIGSMHKDECNAEPYIPIYLIVAGSFSLFICVTNVCGCVTKRGKKEDEEQSTGATACACCFTCISALGSVFLVCWYIAGNVWIYKAYEPSYEDPTASDYCDKTLYLFSFWFLNAGYILAGVGLCFGCVIGCCASRILSNVDED
ncbi:transmembrane protein 272-like [Saccoglossus kowalevskii]|uniref:Uncharacterized protein LOC100374539 n=1 Tax=Saccoglossus kowalevskii TaxID=10224 RepID=A0ABM0GUR1_SACKO|nr:PREDICTED: uncharacterized protein LOC100374539 [Saccoglossus kowalevskii]